MNYIDLFSGIGGFSLGAQWAGWEWENHFYSDIDKYANKIYEKRFPQAVALGDIRQIEFENLKKCYLGEWIITGGFPCQDISTAGKGKGLIDENGNYTRSGLWYEMHKAIRILRPKFVIAENVGAITIRGLSAVLGSLAEIGYDAEWQDIRASDVGAPHRRERIWIVAYPLCLRGQICLQQGLPRLSKLKIRRSGSYVENDLYPWPPSIYDKYGWDKIIKSKSKSLFPGMAYGISFRVDRLKCLGNAIVPQIAEILFRLINAGRGQYL
jgi:DNA (cytosine-5)-methyltransferase 1